MPVFRDEKHRSYYVKCYYKDWTGKRKQKMKRGFARSSEAKAWERDFLNEQTQGSLITFKNLCSHYLNDTENRLKLTTYSTSRNIINNHLIPFFGEKPINEITPLLVRQWQAEILKSGLSQTYIRSINTKLSAVLNYAVKFYNLPLNPVQKAGTIGSSKPQRINFWTLQEFKKFIAGLTEPEEESFRMAFITLFYTGIRLGELLALTPGDIDFAERTLTINKNYVVVDGQKIIQTPKTSKSNRVIILPGFLCKLLQAYIKRLYNQEQRIFFNLNKYSLGRKLKATAAKTGVKAIRIHDLRHSHASLLIELGFNPLVISERLGHENINTTLAIYSHLYPHKGSDVAQKLDSVGV